MTIFADMITLDDIRKPVTAELEALDEFVDRQFTAEGELLSICCVTPFRRAAKASVPCSSCFRRR